MSSGLPPEYADLGPCEGGEVGARRVRDAAGATYVFKAQPPGLAPQVTEALRAVGYPAPRYVAVGDDWCIQEALPGRVLGGWRAERPPELLALNELQEGRAVNGDRSWPEAVAASIVDGNEEFMLVDELTAHSADGRELVHRARSAVEQHGASVPAAGDVVHFDFTASNVLADAGRVTGVIDWGGTCTGDRWFDLVTWWFYAPDDRVLLDHLVERIGRSRLSVYLAHMAIRQAGWSVRHQAPEAGRAMVAYGLELLSAA